MKEIRIRDLLTIVGNYQTIVIYDRQTGETVFSGASVTVHGDIMDRTVKFMSCSGGGLKLEI